MKRLPDIILWVHWFWLVLMVLSPWLLPWYVICLMSGIVLAMNAWNDWHCPVTKWEYRLRRKATERFVVVKYPEDYRVGGMYIPVPTYTPHRVIAVKDGGLIVQDWLPAEAAIDRGLALLGITLTTRAQTTLTLLVLLGAPLLAWWRG